MPVAPIVAFAVVGVVLVLGVLVAFLGDVGRAVLCGGCLEDDLLAALRTEPGRDAAPNLAAPEG